ncbi:hypothetical protein BDQ17DRAFT_1326560 [Cyathus striatus]|nr:hypothetical protein BDQ17DRAFT_1326560 [Cyathus striatus]
MQTPCISEQLTEQERETYEAGYAAGWYTAMLEVALQREEETTARTLSSDLHTPASEVQSPSNEAPPCSHPSPNRNISPAKQPSTPTTQPIQETLSPSPLSLDQGGGSISLSESAAAPPQDGGNRKASDDGVSLTPPPSPPSPTPTSGSKTSRSLLAEEQNTRMAVRLLQRARLTSQRTTPSPPPTPPRSESPSEPDTSISKQHSAPRRGVSQLSNNPLHTAFETRGRSRDIRIINGSQVYGVQERVDSSVALEGQVVDRIPSGPPRGRPRSNAILLQDQDAFEVRSKLSTVGESAGAGAGDGDGAEQDSDGFGASSPFCG